MERTAETRTAPPRTALTLTRKDGEAVSIDGGRVVVRVQSSRGGRTMLRIEAPREVRILRAELTEKGVGIGRGAET